MTESAQTSLRRHGTAVAAGPYCALLRGPSGSGKSDLALRFLALPSEATILAFGHAVPLRLVADDQVDIRCIDGALTASAPKAIAGLIEVRGAGLFPIDYADQSRLRLVADIVDPSKIERLPPEDATTEVAGIHVAHLDIAAFEASAPVKLLLALARAAGSVGTRRGSL